ncbi:hypothetical protein [Sinorhizobium fredii]|uniref:Uncharacterized protein n=1 Tax=Sinorhizobium fredii (strain NBRC 101917 / NGR234) TaxID=394 RepID=Q6W1C7_SINFN|nr:hypothetical protein [Sinorhizobium fredii]AAQ87441.1 Hypothetical protein RNGR00315 [Sinorhizobium fredii NGR234]
MRSALDFGFEPIGPDELELIDKVFKSELQTRALPSDGEQAEVLAATLIRAYQSGIRDASGLSAVAKSARSP